MATSKYLTDMNADTSSDSAASGSSFGSDRVFNDQVTGWANSAMGTQDQINAGYQGYIPNFTGKKGAQQTRAWIANSEWLDYQNKFAPREEELVGRLSDDGALEEINRRLGEIRGTTNSSYASALGDTLRRMQRYGTGNNISAEARTQMLNETGASAARSVIDAENNVRQHIVDRNMNMIAGSGDVIHREYDYGT